MSSVQANHVNRLVRPNLAVFTSKSSGPNGVLNFTPHGFDKVLPEIDAQGLVAVSNRRLSAALIGGDEWRTVRAGLPCYTGTHTASVDPDVIFEKVVVKINDRELERLAGTRYFVSHCFSDDPKSSKRWLYPVHPDYLGKQNSILVAEHPNYTLHVDGNRILTLPIGVNLNEAVDLVEGLPTAVGWYRVDSKHHIPTVDGNGPELWLGRSTPGIGFVTRGWASLTAHIGISHFVALNTRPSIPLGVVVESDSVLSSISSTTPNVTRAGEGDINGILEVQAENLQPNKQKVTAALEQSGFLVYPLTYDEVKGIIDDPENHLLLVAKIEGVVVGYVLAYSLTAWNQRDPEWLKNVSVHPLFSHCVDVPGTWYGRHISIGKSSATRRNVGLELITVLSKEAAAKGAKRIFTDILEAPVENMRSAMFMVSNGYSRVGTLHETGGIVCGLYIAQISK